MVSAIIVAAGRGTRMVPDVDKLFLEVAGAPVIAHTWRRFDNSHVIDELILVVRDGMQSTFHEMAELFHFRKQFKIVSGGKERQDSVWNGLEVVSGATEIVLIQDGARPCASETLIIGTIEAARLHGAAVAAQRVVDTIKESDDGSRISKHLDRRRLWSVQTPQTFRTVVIRQALQAVRDQNLSITDDTAACELIGQSVRLVENPLPNPKVTVRDDLPYVELLLNSGRF